MAMCIQSLGVMCGIVTGGKVMVGLWGGGLR